MSVIKRYNATTGQWERADDVNYTASSDAFIATYGETTYAEVLAAHTAGERITVVFPEESEMTGELSYSCFTEHGMFFSGIVVVEVFNWKETGAFIARIDEIEGWSLSTNMLVNETNILDEIDEDNLKSFLPTDEAVANFVNAKISELPANPAQITYDEGSGFHAESGYTSEEDKAFSESIDSYKSIRKIRDYEYLIEYDYLDYLFALEHIDDLYNPAGACTSIRNGNFYGRNFDWFYDTDVTFITRTSNVYGKYASIGISVMPEKLNQEFMNARDARSARNAALFKLLPFRTMDGINEKGVTANVNVVAAGEKGLTTGTNPGTDRMSTAMIVRWVLDNADTARSAVEGLEEFDLYSPQGNNGYDFHFMVADENETYLIEFINNTYCWFNMETGESNQSEYSFNLTGYTWMTNFHLTGVAKPTDKFNGTNVSTITSHGSGVERWNIVKDNYTSAETMEGMTALMEELHYTKYSASAETVSDPFWYTEYTGETEEFGNLTVSKAFNSPSDFNGIVSAAAELYTQEHTAGRSVANITWETSHTSIFDIESRELYILIHEESSSNIKKYGIFKDDEDSSKMNLVPTATDGNIAIFDENGQVEDSGMSAQEVDTAEVVESISSASTNEQIPTAKAVYDSVSGVTGTFVAVYNETTFDEIEEAYETGKTIQCEFAVSQSETAYLSLVCRATTSHGAAYVFEAVGPSIISITMESVAGWLEPEMVDIELQSQKVTEVTELETEDNTYPTTKAVADYVSDVASEKLDKPTGTQGNLTIIGPNQQIVDSGKSVVTEIGDESTDSEIPTAKAVIDMLDEYVKYVYLNIVLTTQDSQPVTGQTVTVRKGTSHSAPAYRTLEYDGQPVFVKVPIGFDYFIEASAELEGYFECTTAIGVAESDITITLSYNYAVLNITATTPDSTPVTGQTVTIREGRSGSSPVWKTESYDGQPISVRTPVNFEYFIEITEMEGYLPPTTADGIAVDVVNVSISYGDLSLIQTYDDILDYLPLPGATAMIGVTIDDTWSDGNTTFECPTKLVAIKEAVGEDEQTHKVAIMQRQYCTNFTMQFDAAEGEVCDPLVDISAEDGIFYYGQTGTSKTAAAITLLTLEPGDPIPHSDYDVIYKDSIRDTTKNMLIYGYNRYRDSAYRQYLNSIGDIGQWFVKNHVGDNAPSTAATKQGYLKGCSQAMLAAAKKIYITCQTNTVTDGGVVDRLCDLVWAPSVTEMYGSLNPADDTYFPYWKSATGLDAPANSANVGRITYSIANHNSAQACWLRSAFRSYSYIPWFCHSSGRLTTTTASYAFASAPAFAIY